MSDSQLKLLNIAVTFTKLRFGINVLGTVVIGIILLLMIAGKIDASPDATKVLGGVFLASIIGLAYNYWKYELNMGFVSAWKAATPAERDALMKLR